LHGRFTLLTLYLVHEEEPRSPQRLSALVDSSVFIAPPRTPTSEFLSSSQNSTARTPDVSLAHDDDDLLSSPLHVEPYPARPQAAEFPDTPTRQHAETVYDRFLMATSGVKRVGQGYQSVAPPGAVRVEQQQQQPQPARPAPTRRTSRLFSSARRAMPPPVSSEDVRRAMSFDELGRSPAREGVLSPTPSNDEHTLWRSLKAATTRRMSKVF
jgi:serine/threonine-protein kinase GIN4